MANSEQNHPQKFLLPKLIRRFLEMEASGGIIMMLTAALAMIAANSGFSESYYNFIKMPITIGYGDSATSEPLSVWVKDVLMVLFFLLVGLELKREAVDGFLAKKEQIFLPLFAALGGMVAPALIFIAINRNIPENLAGWAIPSATDIAFALGVLMLIGRSIPPALKIFLLAIAIFDDLGAILIIALFYSGTINLTALFLSFMGIAMLIILNRLRISLIMPYLLVGVYLGFCLHHAGIHTTIAGVLVGLFLPMRCKDNEVRSPVNQAIHFLHPWVGFIILPLFAFTSAGVNLSDISFAEILKPLPLGIAMALFFGKQIGIFGTTLAIVKTGFAKLPENTTWLHIYGISIIAGIGFTMSLFIGILAFPEAMQNEIKIGVICGSLLSIIFGASVLGFYSLLGKKASE